MTRKDIRDALDMLDMLQHPQHKEAYFSDIMFSFIEYLYLTDNQYTGIANMLCKARNSLLEET